MKQPLDPDSIEDHNRMVIAVILSLVIMMGYQFLVAKPHADKAAAVQKKVELAKAENAIHPRADVIAQGARIPVIGKKVTGSLSLKGLRLDDLTLNEHYTAVDRTEHEPLLTPSGAPQAFYAESGWLSDATGVALPNKDTQWTVASGAAKIESGGAPVRLTWNNGASLTFTREISLDDNYLFTITQSVTNNGSAAVKLNPYHLTARNGYPRGYAGLYTLHEGPIGRFNGKLEDANYKKLAEGKTIEAASVQGWLGMTDKYWMAVFLPDPKAQFNARVSGEKGALPHFQADLVGKAVDVAPGQTVSDKTYLYAGVKEVEVMEAYEVQYQFDRLEDSIDFGIWSFITKPFHAVFLFLIRHIGNVGMSVLALTVLVRGAMFPLATRAYVSMAKMKRIQPLLKEYQEKYKGDRETLQQKIMELYQAENANPLSGCWPMIVQIPIFFALYKVILISVELRHAPFWGWIHDLSAPDPTSLFNLFGLIPWTPPQFLMIGGWPILFCLTMVVQKRLAPPMSDPVQEKVQSYFPFFITFMMAHFAVGLVIYWTWSNTLAILQQYYITTKVGDEKVSLIRGHHERHKPKKKKKGA